MSIMLRQLGRLASVSTVLGPDAVVLERLSATERLGEPFTIVLDVVSRKIVDFLPILGTGVGVAMLDKTAVSRNFHGILFEAAHTGDTEAGTRYRLVLRPWTSLLGLGLNTRLWQNKSVKEIIQSVFEQAGMSKFKTDKLTAGLKPREYCVQYRESDFNFVSRLMEEEGIYYFFEHTSEGHTLVLVNEPSHHAPIDGLSQANYYPAGEKDRDEPHLWSWSEQVRPGVQKVSLRDSTFMAPGGPKLAAHELKGDGANDVAEVYDYPAGFAWYKDDGSEDGKPYAKARLLAARAERRRFGGVGTTFALGAGARLKLQNHDHGGYNTDYLIVGATHSLSMPTYVAGSESEGTSFEVHVEAIPLTTPWAPPLRTPKPVAGGPQTAIVVGPPEAKGIHVDKWGRIRVQFYWDRREKDANNQPIKPDNRSCWVRVSQAWADAGFGTMMIPRVGQEVLVDFVDGDPDQPIVVGRVYNNDAMPPHPLPGSKTKSTWKSQTVGDAGSYSQTEEPPPASDKGFNEIGFEDKGGSEQIFIHAQRDMVTWIRHDESWKVGHNVKMRVGYNRETQIKNHETLIVEQGDETHTVKADVGKIEMEAMQSIELKVGQSSIKSDQMGVTVKGPMIKVNASMMLEAKAGAMGTLDGGGMLTVKGGLVMIN